MFAMGGTRMYDRAKRLLAVVAKTIKSQPNKVRVTGHTDSTPFRSKRGGMATGSCRATATRCCRPIPPMPANGASALSC